ncbi:MAG: FAD-dependent oxidoreductase [Pseudomonadota bacterium]
MSRGHPSIQSIVIVGAGIVGLSCALEFARRGVRVSLFEKTWPPRGASWAAAGMLAPAFEAIGVEGGHRDLFQLCDAGARAWPQWAERLERESGLSSGYDATPSLAVALNAADAEKLAAVEAALRDHDQPPEFCTERLGEVEPTVTTNARAALLLPSDGQADNRLTLNALLKCVEQDPRIEVKVEPVPLTYRDGEIDHAGHNATLLTAGWQTGAVAVDSKGQTLAMKALDPCLADVEPISGQMLSVEAIEEGPKTTIRSGHIYIVPKADRIVIGATSEPGRVITAPEVDQIETLRQRAIELCPILATAPVLERWAGIRPGLKNHAPLLGETRIDNLFVASGHYRNGILLAPITAEIMADLILDGNAGALARAFAPRAALTTQM